MLMAEGRCKERWRHTSSILAMLVNVNKGKKGRAAKASDFDPYARRGKPAGAKPKKANIGILKALFVDRDRKAAARIMAEGE